ncbi:hypothetical protein SMNI109538_21755 [Smaragdicoccus niigatensis]
MRPSAVARWKKFRRAGWTGFTFIYGLLYALVAAAAAGVVLAIAGDFDWLTATFTFIFMVPIGLYFGNRTWYRYEAAYVQAVGYENAGQ